MRLRNRQPESPLPEVNLVPMMDVLMTVLTFFIIISMTLSGQSVLNVRLPILSDGKGISEEPQPKNLLIGLDRQGQIILDSKPGSEEEMTKQMVEFLNANPDGIVVLKADSQLPYDKVVRLLEVMRDIGGDRVSLAVDHKNN